MSSCTSGRGSNWFCCNSINSRKLAARPGRREGLFVFSNFYTVEKTELKSGQGETGISKVFKLFRFFSGAGVRLQARRDIDEVSEGEAHKAVENIHCRLALYCICIEI